MDVFENLPPIVALVLGFVLLVWLVLVFLVPFMIEGIRQSARKTHEELVDLNAKLDRLNALLLQRAGPPPAGRVEPPLPSTAETRDGRDTRGRREPTIGEPTVRAEGSRKPGGSRNRREPIVR
jgi:hypothetical protein